MNRSVAFLLGALIGWPIGYALAQLVLGTMN